MPKNAHWPDTADDLRAPPGTYVVEFSIRCPEQSSDVIDETVSVHTNQEGFELISLPVIGRIIAPVTIHPGTLSFGEVSPEESVVRSVTLVSRVNQPRRIVRVNPGDAGLQCDLPTSSIDGKAELQFALKGSRAGEFAGSDIEVIVELTDSRRELSLRLPVAAWQPA